jgi:cellulose synthase/poly-beta-1,6-N-acetylglucosamine synthase-like glycosyltransferase
MTTTQATVLTIYAAIVALWPVRSLVLELVLRQVEILTRQSPRYDDSDAPMVSAILPAKDEEFNLADCLGSICRQTYRNLEIIVVDDRSTDRTGSIAREHAARDSRIRVLTIDSLPPGWTGKTHALKQAAGQARGSWLWFMDCDTLHAPESLAVLMHCARAHQAALISVLPELRCDSFWEQVVQPLAGITLMQSFPLHRIHGRGSALAFANGQCILVERDAYDAAGGHAAVKERFVEDIGLASQVKSSGARIRLEVAREVVTCRMYSSFQQVVRGWSRIFYDALDRKALRVLIKLLDPLVFCTTGQIALLGGLGLLATSGGTAFALSLLGMAVVHHAFMYQVFRRVYGISVPGSRHAWWFPLGNLVIELILLRSIQMCFTGRVSWRGTEYTT